MPTAAHMHSPTRVALIIVLMPTAAQLHRQTEEDDRHRRQAFGDGWADTLHLQQLPN